MRTIELLRKRVGKKSINRLHHLADHFAYLTWVTAMYEIYQYIHKTEKLSFIFFKRPGKQFSSIECPVEQTSPFCLTTASGASRGPWVLKGAGMSGSDIFLCGQSHDAMCWPLDCSLLLKWAGELSCILPLRNATFEQGKKNSIMWLWDGATQTVAKGSGYC